MKGWCNMSRSNMGNILDLSKQTIITIVNKMIVKKLIRKNKEGHLKWTPKWYKAVIFSGKETVPIPQKEPNQTGKETVPPSVKKLDRIGKETLPYIDINNNKYNNKEEEEEEISSTPEENLNLQAGELGYVDKLKKIALEEYINSNSAKDSSFKKEKKGSGAKKEKEYAFLCESVEYGDKSCFNQCDHCKSNASALARKPKERKDQFKMGYRYDYSGKTFTTPYARFLDLYEIQDNQTISVLACKIPSEEWPKIIDHLPGYIQRTSPLGSDSKKPFRRDAVSYLRNETWINNPNPVETNGKKLKFL